MKIKKGLYFHPIRILQMERAWNRITGVVVERQNVLRNRDESLSYWILFSVKKGEKSERHVVLISFVAEEKLYIYI